jgi:hypothetical protein
MLIFRTNDFKIAALCGALLIAAAGPGIARAALGEPEASVPTDVAQLQGSIKASTDRGTFRIHEIQMPSGTVLREFVSLDGIVFAVAWNGPYMPNLRQALGRYFDSYVAAAKLNHMDRKHLQINQPDLVVQAAGHMRAFSGRAYLPAALPSGFNLGDLQ